MRSAVVGPAFIAILVAGPALPAWADAAGPTDYQSVVVSVDPPAEGVTARIIGGDAFLEIVVAPGRRVDVIGYRAEPYLRFLPDGRVEVNDNAPTTYLSEDRYGTTPVPDRADPDAPPAWRTVSESGSYAWHDHRTHWMNESRPAAEPGDTILEYPVPIVVDGVATQLLVRSTWVPAPSPVPAVAGAVAGLLVGLVARRSDRAGRIVLVVTSGAAAVVSWLALSSVPPETGPSLVPLVASATAVGLVGYGLLRPEQDRVVTLAAPAIILLVWGLLRRDWLIRAVLPTTAPDLDRVVTAAVLVCAIAITLHAAMLTVGRSRRFT